jgi:hypothetical protein
MQELTGLRIIAINGLESLGVPVPEWSEESSTPLRLTPTLGARVRSSRKQERRQQRRMDEQSWLVHQSQRPMQFGAQSYPVTTPAAAEGVSAAAAPATAGANLVPTESPGALIAGQAGESVDAQPLLGEEGVAGSDRSVDSASADEEVPSSQDKPR